MGEMNSALQGTNHIGKIILQVGAVGTGAEGDTVVGVIHHLHHPQDVGLVYNDSGQAEYTPGGIVRMDRHVDVVFVADRHNAFKKIFQVCKQLFVIHVFIHFKQLFHPCHAFRLPAGHYGAVHFSCDGVKHFFRIQGIHGLLCVCQYGGAVGPHPCQLGSGPVKHGHEVITYHMNSGLPQTLQGSNIIIDIPIPVRRAYLDGIVDIHALNAGQLKTCVLDFLF